MSNDNFFYRDPFPDVSSSSDLEVLIPELDGDAVRRLINEPDLSGKYATNEFSPYDKEYQFESIGGETVKLHERFGQWHVSGNTWGVLDGFRSWFNRKLGGF